MKTTIALLVLLAVGLVWFNQSKVPSDSVDSIILPTKKTTEIVVPVQKVKVGQDKG